MSTSTSTRLADAHRRLVAAVELLTSGDEWRRFLETSRRFRSYSINNTLLIFAQRPDATRVAGYRAWRALGRQVRRGEQGIAILAPCTYRRTDAEEEADAPSRVLRGFKVVHVFDISQTDGEPLPELPVTLLGGDEPDGLTHRLAALIRAEGYTFTLGPLPAGHSGANGLTDYVARTVVVRDDLQPAQQAKTTAHELAHVLLHDPAAGVRADRSVVEIEAESVAYLVCGENGLSSDAYSFGYVAVWAGGAAATVRDAATRVTNCAARVIDALEREPQTRAA